MSLQVLKEPYPFETSISKLLISTGLFGTFIFLFLVVFQPFGIDDYESDIKVFQLAGYGLITSFGLIFNHFFFKFFFSKWFNKRCWTIQSNLIYTIWILFFIGLANLVYSVWAGFLDYSFDSFLYYQGVTVLVGIIPLTIVTFIVYNRRLHQMVKEASILNKDIHAHGNRLAKKVEIPSQNKSEKFSLNIDQLFTIQSIENYVEVVYIDNEIKKQILRNTLQNIEESLKEFKFIKRCHRSYLVNLNNITEFSGNAQGLKLLFEKTPTLKVPVSRKYVKEIKNFLIN